MVRRSSALLRIGDAACTFTLVAVVALLSLTLSACAPATQGPAAAAENTATAPAPGKKYVPGDFNLTVPPPSLLTADNIKIQPRTGDDLAHAKLTYRQIILRTPRPDYLKPVAVDPQKIPKRADDADVAEPDSAAVKHYVLGRAAYQDGDRWQAIEQLEQATRLDPKSPQILKLLGEVYFTYGNQVKGADRLAQAVRLEPNDVDSLFFLGRFAFQKGQWDEVIATLAQSAELDQNDVDPAVAFLRPYYLGQALLQQGYDEAAIDQFRQYLRLPENFDRATRLHRELAFLDRQRGLVQVQLGDACCRLARFDEALAAYDGIDPEDQQIIDAELLVAHRIYAQLAMKQPRLAEQTLIDWLGKAASSPRALKLLTYLAEQNGKPKRLIDSARQVYEKTGRPPTLALAVAQLLTDDQAADFLLEHLKFRPNEEAVFQELVTRLTENHRDRLLAVVLEMIRRQPRSADQFAAVLTTPRTDPDEMLALLDKMPPSERDSAAGFYVRGALNAAAGRTDAAAKAYDKAFAADPFFLSPQLATVRLKVRLGRYEEALTLLDQVAKAQGTAAPTAELRIARAEVYAGLNRFDDAIALIDQLMGEQPRDMKYPLFKARLQREKRDFEAADRTLWSALDVDPTSEEIYAAIFDLYDDPGNPRIDYNQRLVLLKRVQREIPTSRIARLKAAEFYSANRAFDRAEEMLKQLIKEKPDDIEALAALAGVMGATDRWADAEKLVNDSIDKRPEDANLLRLLGEVCQKTEHMPAFYARMETYLKRQKPSFERSCQLAQVYVEWDKPELGITAVQEGVRLKPDPTASQRLLLATLYERLTQYDKALEQAELAMKDKPEKAADILYFKSSIYNSINDLPKSEQTLEAVLKIDPDHVRANNDLGYLYADQNRNLLDAEKMTLKSVAAEPERGAYLDSLGWVYYKLGRFEEALRRFEEARTKQDGDDPVILDHLGDTLWRLKQNERATDFWKAALKSLSKLEPKRRAEMEKIRIAIDAKLKAVEAGNAPIVAPIASEVPAKPPPK